jgi:hypothetical protein
MFPRWGVVAAVLELECAAHVYKRQTHEGSPVPTQHVPVSSELEAGVAAAQLLIYLVAELKTVQLVAEGQYS